MEVKTMRLPYWYEEEHEESENEFWFDYKIDKNDVRFPEYKGNRNGDVVTYIIDKLIK
jgi:hypothetical protein